MYSDLEKKNMSLTKYKVENKERDFKLEGREVQKEQNKEGLNFFLKPKIRVHRIN